MMTTINATVRNEGPKNEVQVSTNGKSQSVSIPAKLSGPGSAVNGGELLLLALASCYCNDIYREAAKRNIPITSVEVQASATFGSEGQPGMNFRYKPVIVSTASPEQIADLVRFTDTVAEIHNTLRAGTVVHLDY